MARVTPTSGSKALYILCIIVASFLLYLDINYKTFDVIKNQYNSLLISSSFALKKISIDPISYIYNLLQKNSDLINENKELKKKLDESYLSNFIISRDTKFFSDGDHIKSFMEKHRIKKIFHSSVVRYFDTEKYFCCDQHQFFIEILNKSDGNFIGSPVINSQGILGQIINDDKYHEVLLLTDTSHSLPIEADGFFCNAKGSGKPGIISCTYSSLIWPEPIKKGQEFFTSGLGGIYPRGVLIGYVSEIKILDKTNFEFDISLVSNPMKENTLGVLERL